MVAPRNKPKAPPTKGFGIHEPEKFQEFIEILEVCRNLIHSQSSVRIRLAIVLLDNMAEVLMLHKCRTILEDDDFSKRIVAPQYSLTERTRVARDFGGKIWFLTTKVRLIADPDATTLRIGHSYRNAGFHRDEHNDDANQVIVSLLFEAVCHLLTVVYGEGTISGGDESVVRWLMKYGVDQPYLDYGNASREIGNKLLEGISVSHEQVVEGLTQDLKARWRVLVADVSRAFPLPELVLDEILKTEEFDAQYDYDSGASERFRQVTRLIGQGQKITRREYDEREREFLIEVREAYRTFTPSLTWEDVRRMDRVIAGLRRQRTTSRVLGTYEAISDRLAEAEHLVASAIRKSEAAAEMAAEIAMGK